MTLSNYLNGIATAIREKKGTTAQIPAAEYANEIKMLNTVEIEPGSDGVFYDPENPTVPHKITNMQEDVVYDPTNSITLIYEREFPIAREIEVCARKVYTIENNMLTQYDDGLERIKSIECKGDTQNVRAYTANKCILGQYTGTTYENEVIDFSEADVRRDPLITGDLRSAIMGEDNCIYTIANNNIQKWRDGTPPQKISEVEINRTYNVAYDIRLQKNGQLFFTMSPAEGGATFLCVMNTSDGKYKRFTSSEISDPVQNMHGGGVGNYVLSTSVGYAFYMGAGYGWLSTDNDFTAICQTLNSEEKVVSIDGALFYSTVKEHDDELCVYVLDGKMNRVAAHTKQYFGYSSDFGKTSADKKYIYAYGSRKINKYAYSVKNKKIIQIK